MASVLARVYVSLQAYSEFEPEMTGCPSQYIVFLRKPMPCAIFKKKVIYEILNG